MKVWSSNLLVRNPPNLSQHSLEPRLLSKEERGLKFHRGTCTKMLYYVLFWRQYWIDTGVIHMINYTRPPPFLQAITKWRVERPGSEANKAAILQTFSMLLPQPVEHIGGVKPSIVTQLSWDDLQRLGNCSNNQLLLARHRTRVVPQVLAQLNLNCTTTCVSTIIETM